MSAQQSSERQTELTGRHGIDRRQLIAAASAAAAALQSVPVHARVVDN
jgi:hypothetical protein